MAFPPNLFLIGAQKAGTTFLAGLLGKHSDICLSYPKEPAYFTRNYDKGLEWYRSKFSDHHAEFLLDATTGYSNSPLGDQVGELDNHPQWGVPQRIAQLSGNARILYLVRDPVDRTYSSYWHNVRAGHERRSLREAMIAGSTYLRASQYCDQLNLYRNYFHRDRIRVLRFEDLIEDPLTLVNECLSFLQLTPLKDVATKHGHNRSFVYAPGVSYINRALSRIGGLNRIAKAVRPIFSARIQSSIYARIANSIPEINPDDKEYLRGYFHEHNIRLSEEYCVDVRHWT